MGKNNYILMDKKSTFIDKRARIGENVIIYENNRIDGECVIGDNVTIYPNSFIVNSIIGKGSKIYSSLIENSKIGERCLIGIFTHLKRVNLDNGVMISSFSELKNKNLTKTIQPK